MPAELRARERASNFFDFPASIFSKKILRFPQLVRNERNFPHFFSRKKRKTCFFGGKEAGRRGFRVFPPNLFLIPYLPVRAARRGGERIPESPLVVGSWPGSSTCFFRARATKKATGLKVPIVVGDGLGVGEPPGGVAEAKRRGINLAELRAMGRDTPASE
ncbi:MAG: hypothetical protein LBC18_16405 [Opitutaceae bacterium]|nr:hypothetical protein [Opitutaceae bacterium]